MPPAKKKLTLKQRQFVENYADPNSNTFGQMTKSYLAAGYKDGPSVQNSAAKEKAKSHIAEAITKYRDNLAKKGEIRQEITAEYAREALMETYRAAKAAGDITNQVACSRMFLQTTGQLSDRLVIDVNDARQLEEHKQHQARQIASVMLEGHLLPDATPIDAEFEDEEQDDDQGDSPINTMDYLSDTET